MVETRKFKAHDPENKCQMGDVVRIEECPPISRDKRWQVIEVTGHSISNAASEVSSK
jgi:SSU ribosomal protein S17P